MSNDKNRDEREPVTPMPLPGMSYEPSRKDRLRPAELLIFSGILAVFVGLVVLIATREFLLAGISLGVVFIVCLVVLAMFSLSFKSKPEEEEDLRQQDEGK
ncbi:hypothetical protein OSC27_10950 [Microbacterium sp. STN6]|uniref:hypothetical protein n=1 Tax=Microbacterium sp. STN6 TaxID=2995588 RepID=UPI002260AA1B|nr:hypothetical protein [Microbacterium sp. STN6]MCX7522791.1 hypothetical protein [Microbacterium sp. STN6]